MAKGKNKTEPEMAYDDKKWRAESDMRTLVEAEQIKSDPARLKAAQAMAGKQLKEIKAIVNKEA